MKNKIKKAEVISFDIFDTLLVRPYVKPIDLFLHMEKVFHKPLFQICRIEAEQVSRRKNPHLEDVTFDMIYDEIDDEFKDMKQKELDWEEMVLRANPEMKQVYDYARQQGKKIVIASDMYLPTDFIAKVLRKNGYEGWDKLYVSGDIGKTKCSGNLYAEIKKDLNVGPGQILHIGDNKKSDFAIPSKLGIKSIRYSTVFEQYKQSDKRYKEVARSSPLSLGLSIILGVMSYQWIFEKYAKVQGSENYWNDIGYKYAGPTCYAYTRFVENMVRNNQIDCLLFVARDGYLLQKIFNMFNPSISTRYVYAPRFLNHICRLDYVKRNTQQAQAIIDFYKTKSPVIEKMAQQIVNPHKFIQNNKELFYPLVTEQMQQYRNYLLQTIPQAQRYALVDTITGEFSSQKILQSALQKEILGIYWGICEEHNVNKYEHHSFVGVHQGQAPDFFTYNWNFMEFLMTSPEYPIKNIDAHGKPVHAEQESSYEIERAELYPKIEEGALSFVSDIKNWFGGYDIYLSFKDIVKWVNAYIEYPCKKDFYYMQKIRIGEDSMHKNWIPLFYSKINFLDFLRSPKQMARKIQKMPWRTPFQSILLCIKKPISIHIKGLKKVDIAFFPYLRERYFTLSLGNVNSIYYRFVIGKIKGE